MKTLWFKGEFVAPILSGEKRDTIRKASTRIPKCGDIVAFSVGPRPAFAKARILSVKKTNPSQLSTSRLAQVAGCYDASVEQLVRISFELTP